jgi:hypothetical protein
VPAARLDPAPWRDSVTGETVDTLAALARVPFDW